MSAKRALITGVTGQDGSYLADTCIHLLREYSAGEHINVGYGKDISIAHLADKIAGTVGFTGQVVYDTSKPDGTPQKLMDSSRLEAVGWSPSITLEDGLPDGYADYLRIAG